MIFSKSWYKRNNAASRRTVSSVLNSGYKFPSKVIWGSAFDCNSHNKNARFHQFGIGALERTW